MGNLVVHMFMTLDGVVQAPGSPDEDREGGFGTKLMNEKPKYVAFRTC